MKLILGILAAVAIGAAVIAGRGEVRAGGGTLGDVNCDGFVTAIDVALLLQLDAGLIQTLPCGPAGDVDFNAELNSLDGVVILQHIAGLLPSLLAQVSVNTTTTLPVSVGAQVTFDVRILNVRHLAGYDFALTFPEGALEFDQIVGEGDFFNRTERAISCIDPVENPSSFGMSCVTIGPPICLGGSPGASGNGSLGRVTFTAMTSGTLTIGLSSNLVSDNIQPCADDGVPIPVPHTNAGTQITVVP